VAKARRVEIIGEPPNKRMKLTSTAPVEDAAVLAAYPRCWGEDQQQAFG
jgi:hypothetical protein